MNWILMMLFRTKSNVIGEVIKIIGDNYWVRFTMKIFIKNIFDPVIKELFI
jgi:hypothetical protein